MGPTYRYDLGLLDQTANVLLQAANEYDILPHYAIKANNNPLLLDVLRKPGIGIDCVSGEEVLHALDIGFAPMTILLAGAGKTYFDLEVAVRNGIGCIHVENLGELDIIENLASKYGTTVNIALRINPDVDGQTHERITTGILETKFGLTQQEMLAALMVIRDRANLHFDGFHFHIGSQITDMNRFTELARKASLIVAEVNNLGYEVRYLNLGGGLGINYTDPLADPIPDFHGWFHALRKGLDIPAETRVRVEPGRSLVGQCGSLEINVLYIKPRGKKLFAIMDGGMHNLMRPALYGSEHAIRKLGSDRSVMNNKLSYEIVGPNCESSDVLGTEIQLSELRPGDRLAVLSSGAYAESMTLNYNLRRPANAAVTGQLVY